jgi:phosphoglycerol transferase MdoB-like AlkP superfamily enzyme
VKELSKFKPPFFSSVFTLSSHHPFELPETEKGKFKGGNLEIHKTIQYSDDALRNFFRLASKEAWYKNTLFVITADHTGPTEDAYFSNAIGNYKIPLLFFTPSETIHRQDQKIVQQVDILPSVLHLLSYDRSFFSFGNNVFDSLQPRFAVNFQNGLYQYLEGDKIFQFNMGEIKSVYSILKDSLLKNPLSLKKYENDSGVIRYKSFLQTYQNSVIRNQTNSE